jgi:ATP-dependent protease ClpP protease subunit
VFLAGTHRYACPHATFMFHGVAMQQSSPASLGEKELKEFLGSISADHTRIAGVIHDETAMPVEQVRTLFIEAQTKDADFAKANNIVSDIRGVAIPQGAPLLQLVFQR